MTEKFSIPDFVEEADGLFQGVAEEYSALKRLSLCLLAKQNAEGLKRTVLLQCGIAWQDYQAILLFLANRYGVQGLVLCRTLFELVVGVLYLLKNPSLLPDFLDYGKLVLYKQALAASLPESTLAPIRQECEKIRVRFRREEWHHSNLRNMAEAVRLDQCYEMFYPEASAAAHSDATKTLSHGPQGWNHDLSQFIGEMEADYVRYMSFQLIGLLFCEANKDLRTCCDQDANALKQLWLERARSAAMPN